MLLQPFTLVRPAVSSTVPEGVVRLIEREGVPSGILPKMYEVNSLIDVLPIGVGEEGATRVASFATLNMFGALCIDCETFEVVYKASMRSARRGHVNGTLEQFNRSVRTLFDQWPFYHASVDDDDDEEEGGWESAADALERSLSAVDVTSMSFQSFWQEIVSEVRFGQFSVEEKLPHSGHPPATCALDD